MVTPDPQGFLVVRGPRDFREKEALEDPEGKRVKLETEAMMAFKEVPGSKEERVTEVPRDQRAPKELLANREVRVMLDREEALEDRVSMELAENEESLGTTANLVDRGLQGFAGCREKQGKRVSRVQSDQEGEMDSREIRDFLESVAQWEEMEPLE